MCILICGCLEEPTRFNEYASSVWHIFKVILQPLILHLNEADLCTSYSIMWSDQQEYQAACVYTEVLSTLDTPVLPIMSSFKGCPTVANFSYYISPPVHWIFKILVSSLHNTNLIMWTQEICRSDAYEMRYNWNKNMQLCIFAFSQNHL